MIQGTENFSWGDLIPILVSVIALIVTVLGHRNKAKRNELDDLRWKIKIAEEEAVKVNDKLKDSERENKILRKDKYDLIERLSKYSPIRETDRER